MTERRAEKKKKLNPTIMHTHKVMALYLEKFTWWPHWFQWQYFASFIAGADKSHCFSSFFNKKKVLWNKPQRVQKMWQNAFLSE